MTLPPPGSARPIRQGLGATPAVEASRVFRGEELREQRGKLIVALHGWWSWCSQVLLKIGRAVLKRRATPSVGALDGRRAEARARRGAAAAAAAHERDHRDQDNPQRPELLSVPFPHVAIIPPRAAVHWPDRASGLPQREPLGAFSRLQETLRSAAAALGSSRRRWPPP